jgi:hypothetical protein
MAQQKVSRSVQPKSKTTIALDQNTAEHFDVIYDLLGEAAAARKTDHVVPQLRTLAAQYSNWYEPFHAGGATKLTSDDLAALLALGAAFNAIKNSADGTVYPAGARLKAIAILYSLALSAIPQF